jgi:DNA-binding transcriptional regulator LsrR (DeoR family)
MNDKTFLYKIAVAYYDDQLTQAEIAKKYGLSRIKVSRLLQRVRDLGIVEISIQLPDHGYADLEHRLALAFGLDEVILSNGETGNRDVLQSVGEAGADYFSRIIQGNEIIGLTWGTTLAALVDNLHPSQAKDIRIVQMLGGLGSPELQTHSTDLVRRTAAAFGASGRILSAPGIVSNGVVKKGLLADPYIRETLELAASADVAFVGIGIASKGSLLLREGTKISSTLVEKLKKQGAVGDISLCFFNDRGEIIGDIIEEGIIGVTPEDLRMIPRVVGVAAGREKYRAIKGALKTGILNVLITDLETGKKLLKDIE